MKNKTIFFGLVVFSVLLLASSIGAASAIQVVDDDDSDGFDDDYELETARSISIEDNGDEITIESRSQSGNTEDEVEIKLKFESEATSVSIGYEREVGTSEREAELEIEFEKLVEFVDQNNDSLYDLGEEISERLLNDLALNEYKTVLSTDNETLHYLNVSTPDDIFFLHVYASEKFSILDNITITPYEVKIDIEINGFVYSNDESQLALLIDIESEYEHEEHEETDGEEEGYAENESSIETKVEGTASFFAWAETAIVDGVEKIVRNTPIVDDDDGYGNEMYLVYERGDHIYHDPKIGISFANNNDIVLILAIVGIVAAVGVIATVLLVRRYR